ncbi:tetratricopeptide repeat protein [Mucilaginibacter sp. Bleaf8]|uniref:tetratricopeptide repeat protein n=1 Tax=Mucilaginibacter sp. Bleaf8 TaxID=2834430 RepID=UPI001BD0F03F|nr:tetratricopeptide repeat protein [Mucilaginibacter sp. Bleaf8]MBS7566055.1 tetratricopeptide repeat protein [Mucilaginibacter sp. Bleaf8]
MKFKHALLGLCWLSAAAVAQSNMPGRKPLTSVDSLMVQQLYFSALREKTIENLPQATELFSKVLQTDAGNDAAMYELANLLKLQSKRAEAQQLLERAVTVKPDNEWYWVSLAESYEKTNNIGRLQHVFDELIRINPDKPEYYFDKANALYLEKRYDEALNTYSKLEQLTGPTEDLVAARRRVYLRQGKVDGVAEELERLIVANPNETKFYLQLGELYNANNFPDKALHVLQRGEKVSPQNGMLQLALADSYRAKKDNETSFTHLEKAFAATDLDVDQKVRIVLGYLPKFPEPNAKASATALSKILADTHPNDAKALAVYGDMLLQSEKYKEAKVAYKKAIQLNNGIYAIQEQLVRLELGDNEVNEAIKDGENSLSMFPNQAWMNYLVGVAWLQKKDPQKAVAYLKNAADLETQDKELLGQANAALGDTYHELKDNTKSDAAYEKALSYNADNAYTLNNYAYYLSIRGEQLDKAARMSKRSNELQPNTPSFEDTYAWILFRQKKYSDARLWMEKALQHDKKQSAVQTEHYGDIMFYLGDTEAAVQNWKKAKQNGAQSPVLDRKINEKKYIE